MLSVARFLELLEEITFAVIRYEVCSQLGYRGAPLLRSGRGEGGSAHCSNHLDAKRPNTAAAAMNERCLVAGQHASLENVVPNRQ